MKPVFDAAKKDPRRIVYAEGEDERVLRAVQIAIDEGIARPIVIGRPAVLQRQVEKLGLRIRPGTDFPIVNPESDPRFRAYWTEYYALAKRKGVSEQYAKIEMRQRLTLIGAMMIHMGEADGMLCGTFGTHALHLHYVDQVIGKRAGVKSYYAMNLLMLPHRSVFIADTYVNHDPDPEQLTEMCGLACEEIRRFGLTPKVALVSHSSFGSSQAPSATKMREALQLIWKRFPEVEAEGEMHGDAALKAELRQAAIGHSKLNGDANLLLMPTLDAANISFNLLKTVSGDGITIGPMLLGAARAVHILTPTATVRRIVNMTALTVVAAQERK
jgi:malate dehydrogenase (oxaloacetate-decarboxylating)(NADP+)